MLIYRALTTLVLIAAAGVTRPALAVTCVPPAGAAAAVAGPIAVSSVGNPDRNYPWAATTVDLASRGYVEQEYWVCGQLAVGAYTTRMIVRRPLRADRANGVVLAEWLNVTDGDDQDLLWLRSHDHLIDAGYTYIGISTQRDSLYATPNGLKAWSPKRYAELSFPQGSVLSGTYIADPVPYQVYAQILQLLKKPGTVNPLGPVSLRWLIATGGSQSAGALTAYYDALQTTGSAADGFLPFNLGASMLVAWQGNTTQANVAFPGVSLLGKQPFFLINSETEPSFLRQPDSARFRLWEVAGATHSDQDQFEFNRPLRLRDLGVDIAQADAACAYPPRSRIHFKYVLNAAMDAMVKWLATGTPPPSAPGFSYDLLGQIRRDADGNVLGGLRLAGETVPTAVNRRDNTGPGLCGLYGRYVPLSVARLRALYPSHTDYVQRVAAANAASVQSGYVLADDAERDNRAAQQAPIPPGL